MLESHISTSPNHLTGKRLTPVIRTKKTAIQMPMLTPSPVQYWMISPAAVSSSANVMAQLNQYIQPTAKPKLGSTKREA
jgi:hypothetical protein